jgi:hypothetical protein
MSIHLLPPGIACIINGEVVTVEEARRNRRESQAEHLRRKLAVERETHAWKLWVAYFDQRLMGGWQAFLERQGERVWIDRDRKWLMEPLMKLFPTGALFDDWHDWKRVFAKRFERRRQDRRPLGVAFVWWDGCNENPTLEKSA